MCAFSSVGAGAAAGCRCCSSVGRAACLRVTLVLLVCCCLSAAAAAAIQYLNFLAIGAKEYAPCRKEPGVALM